jgi:hypothetical protein
MDSECEMMIQKLMQDEANASVGDEDKLMIISCLLGLGEKMNASGACRF